MRRAAVQRLLETQAREHGKHTAALLAVVSEQNDRIMFLAGRTWQPSPAATVIEPPEPDGEKYTASPEQYNLV